MPPLGQPWLGSGTEKKQTNRTMNLTMVRNLILTLLVLSVSACGGKKENRQLKEAAKVHEEMMERYDSVYHALIDKRKEINERMDQLQGEKKSANESMLRSIKKSLDLLQSWEESVIGVPGFEFEYHHHHHHDEDGHDHHHHHHGRENDKLLRGMSDREVLAMQKALRTRLNEVSQEINILLETIKQYEGRED